MENYYKILEVDKEASPEIIEKAYKTLVKKYHPDLKEGEEKIIAENKIKQINEAYAILSDEFKREEYDKNIANQYISIEEYNSILNENNILKKEIINLKNNFNNNYRQNYYTQNNSQFNNSQTNNSAENYYNTTQNNAQQNNVNKTNYNTNSKNSLKNIFKMFVGLFLCFLFIYLFFQIPYIKNLFDGFFGDNFLFFIIIIIIIYFYFFRKK